MTFEETIQACFDQFPRLYETRKDVLNHLFCVIGNGYDWVNGQLTEDCLNPPINPLDNGKAKQYKPFTKGDQRREAYEYITKEKRLKELWNEILKRKAEEKGFTLESYFLSPREDDNEPYRMFPDFKWYPLCKEYSYIYNYPVDIQADWLAGIEETKTLLRADGIEI